ncbi:MAG: serine/threonine protein phosphatase [Gammaproteobacteria bacterium]|nr:serine/threonine protein phosphatase [Gammaproteobacteria bacterium]
MPQINPDYLKDIENDLARSKLEFPCVFQTYSKTHVGLVRDNNEDALYTEEQKGLWLVADGMGGHSKGEQASAAVVDNLRSFTPMETLSESIKDLETRFILANNTCRNMYLKKTVGSTVAALFVYQSLATFLWAGDSRIYRFRNGTLALMTEDHNLAQEQFRRGEISQDEAQRMPSANILTRAIGIHQNLGLEMHCAAIKSGDRYLICSDGLYREFLLSEVQDILGTEEAEDVLKKMTEEALERGGKDNITGVLVQVS